MQKFSPGMKTRFLYVIRALLTFAILSITLTMFHVKHNILISIITATACLLFAVIVYLCLFFKNYSVLLGENAIIVKSGVIIKTKRILPLPRLIYAEQFTTPLSRLLGLSRVSLRAVKVNLVIAELERESVLKIINIIGDCGEEVEI